jgi:PKD domain
MRPGTGLAIMLALALTVARADEASSKTTQAQSTPLPPVPAGISADPLFLQPYIDKDETRDAPVRHRYVHGGFKDSGLRFSFYLPDKAAYRGHFFQYLTPVPDSEILSQGQQGESDKIGFAVSHGAYFVETNGGGSSATSGPAFASDPSIGGYRANAAAAQFSRVVAMQMYGSKRPYGYIFGGSGGAYRTVGGMENTTDVWQGAVPFVMGTPMAAPYTFTSALYAVRVLGDKLPGIIDALDAGGGDMYAGLNDEQRAALKELTLLGYPLPAWKAQLHIGLGAFPVLYPGMLAADPSYFTDFWTQPGYEGANPPPSLIEARIQHKTRITRLIMAADADAMGLKFIPGMGQAHGLAENGWQAQFGPDGGQLPVAMQLESMPTKKFLGTDVFVDTASGAGKRLPVQRFQDNILVLAAGGGDFIGKLKVGDPVTIDNSNYLAAQTYHRHQVPTPDYYPWNQYRGADGKPIYPQRAFLLGPQFARGAAGSIPTGKFHGKMILVENLYDGAAWPWSADWYLTKVKENLGGQFDANFRLWYTDHANHGDFTKQMDPDDTVSYLGVLQQALLDLSDWVEKGVPPASSTNYKIVDSQVMVPTDAAARHGIQPVVTVRANGAVRTQIKAGESVNLTATVEAPPGTGKIVAIEWDFESKGTFETAVGPTRVAGETATIKATHVYATPGTYFVTVRGIAQRQGNADTAYTRIQNLGRARIVAQ